MSKNEWDAEFDRLFEAAIQKNETSSAGSLSDGEAEASWQRMKKRLRQEERRSVWLKRSQWASVAAASLAAGAFLFSSLQTTEAFRPMFEMVYKVKGGTVNIQYSGSDSQSTAGAKTAPPPRDEAGTQPVQEDNRDLPDEGTFRRKKVSLEEAASLTQFALPIPHEFPKGYTLQYVMLHFSMGESKAGAAKLVYKQESGESFTILVRKRSYSDNKSMPDGKRSWTGKPQGSGGELEWNDQDTNMIIQGQLTEAEQNKIAAGMTLTQ